MSQLKGIVLIVDDNEQMIKYLVMPLTYCGFKVLSANSAEKANEIMKELKPDVMILDLKLPGMNGIDFLRQLRVLNKNLPVILLSGYIDQFKNQITPELNVFAYLPKRFYREELEKLVFDAIKRPDIDRKFSSTAKARVLVVDDEKEITEIFKEQLEINGYLAGTANSGQEALDLNKEFIADFVITDIKMAGGMDGVVLASELQKAQKPPKKIYFMSGVGDNQESLNKMNEILGRIEHIYAKPFSNSLIEKIILDIDAFVDKKMPRAKAGD